MSDVFGSDRVSRHKRQKNIEQRALILLGLTLEHPSYEVAFVLIESSSFERVRTKSDQSAEVCKKAATSAKMWLVVLFR